MGMGIGRARVLFKRARNAFFPGALILLYHRVGEPELDPQLLSVSRRNFEEHLQVLGKFHTASLNSLLSSARTRRSWVAVTFDDGYADNLWNAKPLLEKYAVPATVFVSVGIRFEPAPVLVGRAAASAPSAKPATGDVVRHNRRSASAMVHGELGCHIEKVYPQNLEWNVVAASDPSPRHTPRTGSCAPPCGNCHPTSGKRLLTKSARGRP